MRDARPVILVTGAPRSGTSLAMQMLGAGGMPLLRDAARPADADNPRGYFELAAVRRTREDASWLARAAGCAVKVVHALVPSLPPGPAYRVIDLRRPWREVLASQRRMLERSGAPADPHEDAALARLFDAQREAMERWTLRVAAAPLLCLDYPEVVADPPAAARALAAFAGVPLDVGAMADAVDPRLYRQRDDRTGAAAVVS